MHAHHYVQYGFCRAPAFELESPDSPILQGQKSFFIPSDKSHRLHLTGTDTVIMVWLDPDYHANLFPDPSDHIEYSLPGFESALVSLYDHPLNCDAAVKIRDIITHKISSNVRERDKRISDAITWIVDELKHETITVDQIAKAVHLSPSRFMHLFSEQTGIPVRKYILWQRLKHALLQIAEGYSITESAHSAGFTDSSHMNRTFNAMFGITPSKIFKNSRFIQVIPC